MNLLERLRGLIRQYQRLDFAEFMQLALYDLQYGYYSSGLLKFGKHGDFVTAPELGPLFGYTLANQCREVLAGLEKPVLLEFGAGSGRLCVDLLRRLEQLDCLPEQYQIIEVSDNLRQRQQQLITAEISHLANRVSWLDSWPEKPLNGVIIGNEVLDAMPVHRFLQTEHGIAESYITLNDQNELIEIFEPSANEQLLAHVKKVLPADYSPYCSEANLFIDGWIAECASILNQGAILLIDYGFPRHEYYHPDRNQGTLMCHYRHQAHTNPLLHIGEQDITAHVDFTHVAEAGQAAGLHVAGYTNQAAFLLANGLLSLLDDIEDGPARVNAQQAVKQLTNPSEMGELFKVIALTKNLNKPLTGFQLYDKRASL
ncbi:class I SAM-dependent methyltransferase [Legionella dresdenensis]|uniref:Class I SAM-dependent methyltransferase n=1 Tax=Legionella dresdenensis TaxID=450200 RepID=A0ABV8CDS9_9GAMM